MTALERILNSRNGRRVCPACRSDRMTRVFADRNRREGLETYGTYVRCQNCGTTYLNPIPDLDSLKSAYGEALVDLNDGQPPPHGEGASPQYARSVSWVSRIARALHGYLKGRPHAAPLEIGEGRLIFDFGCLAGDKLVEYQERGWRVAGLDLNQKGIERARQLLPEGRFHCGDIEGFTPHELFDAIRSDNVLEHVADPGAVLARLRNFLLPGGRIFVMVPNAKALSILLLGKYSINYWVPFHLNLFTAQSLAYLLMQSGFADVKVRTFSPNNSLSWSIRQLVSQPGYLNGEPGCIARLILRLGLVLYPIEVIAGWIGLGEELIAEARR